MFGVITFHPTDGTLVAVPAQSAYEYEQLVAAARNADPKNARAIFFHPDTYTPLPDPATLSAEAAS